MPYYNKLSSLAKPENIILAALVIFYIYIFTSVSFQKHDAFFTTGFDLGINDQATWLLSKGEQPFITIRGLHYFGDHLHLIMIFVAPLFWIWANVKILLLFQTIVLALGAVAVYLIAKEKFDKAFFPLAFAFSYLMYPALQYMNLWHFHPEALVTPLLLFSFYFLLKRKFGISYALILLSVLSKEDIAAPIIFYGAYIFWKHDRKFGALVFFTAIIYLWLALQVLMPYFNDYGNVYFGRFSIFSNPLPDALNDMAKRLSEPEAMDYIYKLTAPTAFLSLANPIFYISLPTMIENLLSNHTYMRTIKYSYTAAIIPFVFISYIYASSIISRRFDSRRAQIFLILIILASAIASNYIFGQLPTSKEFTPIIPDKSNVEIMNEALSKIPPNANVSADWYFNPHLTHRKFIYEYPNPFKGQNWGFRDMNQHNPKTIEYVILREGVLGPELKEVFNNIQNSGEFETIFHKQDIFILKRKQ